MKVVRQQKTIKESFSYEGIGLHTGQTVKMVFKPASPNSGIVFRRVDLEPVVEIPAKAEFIYSGRNVRSTKLTKDGHDVQTVEHVLATIAGLQIDNLIIELDAHEPPEPRDGSYAEIIKLFDRVGYKNQGHPAKSFKITEALSYKDGDVELIALPYNGFRISFTIEYQSVCIGTQYASFDITPEVFRKEIAPSRTFALMSDVEKLKSQGLIKGGNLENAIVVDKDKIINEEPLRFEDEFVRHKILDLLGDLLLVGVPLEGHIIAIKSGHDYNLEFSRMLFNVYKRKNKTVVGVNEKIWGITDIMDIMPHRYPFLLVDRILELQDDKSVVGIKNVTINEPFFTGHFPGYPIMPAVLIVEAMAQVGGILLLSSVDNPNKFLVYFIGIDKAKFRKPVVPGDQIRFELEMISLKRKFCKMKGNAYVDGKLVAEAILTSSIIKR